MTVKELYNWAKENDLLDTEIYYGSPDYFSNIFGLQQVTRIESLLWYEGDWKQHESITGIIIH